MATSSAERIQAYRQRQREAGLPDSSRRWSKEDKRAARRAKAAVLKPFIGCDGEGCGTDALGRQNYMLFRIGDQELFTGDRLTSLELLDFICDAPKEAILVGFAFGYDATMILRDLPHRQQARLFADKESGPGKSRYVWYKGFDIEYLPRQYLRVRRSHVTRLNGKEYRKADKKSVRTIWDTFGFFQKSFLKSIESFQVGTLAQQKAIALNKARRSDFETIGPEERAYCHQECIFLAELMEKLRDYCTAAGIKPSSWNGAGKLAKALHGLHDTMPLAQVKQQVAEECLNFAAMSYYGGRFEISRTGMINQAVHEYDIRSAYPDAMRKLPCLEHGKWTYAKGKKLEKISSLYVALVRFNHEDKGLGQYCGLPVRTKEGRLYWPRQGSGVYWSCELEAAKKLGAEIHIKEGWSYSRDCNCQPFDWVERLYDYRQSIGPQGPGYPIKLGINALYGTLAQRIGNPKYANSIWASLITALTRAKLMDAAAQAPEQIVMMATDGIYSLVELDLPIGGRLGQWEHSVFEDLFIAQPGLYWSASKRKRKSRGLPGKFFEEPGRTESFEKAWSDWMEQGGPYPVVPVELTNFIGMRLAIARGKPETAGVWKVETRNLNFSPLKKRDGCAKLDGHIITAPKSGSYYLVSLPSRDFIEKGGGDSWDEIRNLLQDCPDYVDIGPPTWD